MSQFMGYVSNGRRPRRCEVKRMRMRDGGGKVRHRKPAWFERVVIGPGPDYRLRNEKCA